MLDERIPLCARKRSEDFFMTVADTIRAKLTAALAPDALSIEDESSKHAGHSGARPGGETHFRVRIVSAEFEGVSRVERQRRIYAVLADELRDRVHALALTALTPKEAGKS
jgi:BolA protein